MIAVTLDEWKKKLESPSREIIILHNPKVRRVIPLRAGEAIPQRWEKAITCLPLALLGACHSAFMRFLLTTSA